VQRDPDGFTESALGRFVELRSEGPYDAPIMMEAVMIVEDFLHVRLSEIELCSENFGSANAIRQRFLPKQSG